MATRQPSMQRKMPVVVNVRAGVPGRDYPVADAAGPVEGGAFNVHPDDVFG
jgi:hypothetical protein